MKKITVVTASLAALVSPALAQSPGLWDHNGSAMRLTYANGDFGVYYEGIRPGLRQTIPPGAPRFEGRRIGNQIVGNAFVHTKYCPGRSFPYHVSGIVYDEAVINLYGPAAVVDPNSCSIVGYAPNSDNARVVFRLVQPEVLSVQPEVLSVQPVVPVIATPPIINNGDITKGHTVICPVVGDCLTSPKTSPKAPKAETNGLAEPSPDEQAEALKQQGREFCWKYPGHPVCVSEPAARQTPPTEAIPYDK